MFGVTVSHLEKIVEHEMDTGTGVEPRLKDPLGKTKIRINNDPQDSSEH